MGWEGTRLLSNGEHDELWRNAFKVIPSLAELKSIKNSLQEANRIACYKELHELGGIPDEAYAVLLVRAMEREGVNLKAIDNIIDEHGGKEKES